MHLDTVGAIEQRDAERAAQAMPDHLSAIKTIKARAES